LPHLQPSMATETVERPVAQPAQMPAAPPEMVRPAATAPPLQQPSRPAAAAPRELGSNEELVPISALRRMIADRMVQSVSTIPHATTMSEVDMTSVVRFREGRKEEFRRREGVPLSYVAFVIKATVEALKEFPMI